MKYVVRYEEFRKVVHYDWTVDPPAWIPDSRTFYALDEAEEFRKSIMADNERYSNERYRNVGEIEAIEIKVDVDRRRKGSTDATLSRRY